MIIRLPLMSGLDAENFTQWKGDGQCDDINNDNANGFDDGDCCEEDAVKQFCFDCSCKSKFLNECK